MKRAKASLGFRNKTMTEKVAICGRFIRGVATVPPEKSNYVNLDRLQSSLAAAQAEMNALIQLRKQAIAQTARCHQAVKDLCSDTLSGMLGYSARVSTKADFAAAGLDTVKPARAQVVPPVPLDFRAAPALDEGTVAFRWKRSFRRSSFVLEYTASKSAVGWKHVRTICGTRTVVKGLVSGQLCWFRLYATNSVGQSARTQPLRVRVA